MADLLTDMRTFLLTQTSVTNLVASRIFIDGLPQGVTLPAILLEDPDEDFETTLGGQNARTRSSVHAHAYGTTRASAKGVSDALRDVLKFAAGTWTSSVIKRCLVTGTVKTIEPPRDGSQTFRRVHSLLCAIWHD